jgi:hypothetical protein
VRDDLPTGTVTFLFTDVEGSTKLLHELGAEGYAGALAEHRRVIRDICAAERGVEVDTQGDAFFFAFPTAPEALAAASALTEALAPGPAGLQATFPHTRAVDSFRDGSGAHDAGGPRTRPTTTLEALRLSPARGNLQRPRGSLRRPPSRNLRAAQASFRNTGALVRRVSWPSTVMRTCRARRAAHQCCRTPLYEHLPEIHPSRS